MTRIQEQLFALQDKKFNDFQAGLNPAVDKETMIGVRTPQLRVLAKEMIKEGLAEAFLKELPHTYFEENQLHALILSELKSYEQVMEEVKAFLPHVNNWATCDQLRPKCFKKHRKELLAEIESWISDKETYTIRFGIGMLMVHFLEEDFKTEYLEKVSLIRSEEYYVNMMIAWYFTTALGKQYEEVLPYLEEKRMAPWVHNKTIQKARESYRVSEEQKAYLKSLRV